MPRFERNYERNGIEIYFEKKPSEAVRDTLKANGWRWSNFNKCWYNFYTSANLSFAEQLCGASNSAIHEKMADKQVEKHSSTNDARKMSPPISENVVKSNSRFLPSDRVLVETSEGKKFVGTVDFDLETIQKVYVTYITDSNHGRNFTWSGYFEWDKVKKQSAVLASSVYVGRTVSFVTKEGEIVKGIVTFDSASLGYDIKRYVVSSTGEIEVIEEQSVSLERILEIEYGTNIFPVKVGDKVEFINNLDELVIGKITYINTDGTVDIEFEYIDKWGDKDEEIYVGLDRVRVMTRTKKALDRSLYITEEKQQTIDLNEKIKERIKNRADKFADANSVAQNRILYRHQKAGAMLADIYDKFAFFYDTGTGKTVMALDIVLSKQLKENARFLIIAPKSIIKTAWLDDATNYYPGLKILPLYNGFNAKKKRALLNSWRTGGRAAHWESDPLFYAHVKLISDVFGLGEIKIDDDAVVNEALQAEAQHYIVNSEMFIRDPEKYVQGLNVDGIIMDESAILKNYKGKTASTMREMAEKVKYVYLLSGKPAPNNVVEYFSQMKIVDPDTFSMSYDRFLNMFCYSANGKYEMLPENKALFAEMVSIRSLIISKKDCLDLPETVDVVRQIEIPESIMQDYNELYRECMTIIKGMDNSQLFYSDQSRLAILMKLRQMASGFFMQGSGNSRESKVIVDIHNAKLQEWNSVIDQIEEEQVIIWCQFQHEIEIIEAELSKRAYTVTAYGKTKDLEKNIDDFKTGRAQYIVAHPKTLKYGVTFVNCKYTIYYSFSYSAEDYDQSHDRNYRLGQKDTCTYIYIQAAETIDEIMYEKVMLKMSNADFFERLIKDAAKHGIDYDSLKGKDDSEIREALSADGGEISTIKKNIALRDYSAMRNVDVGFSRRGYCTYDYLDKIEGPTEYELKWIEDVFLHGCTKEDEDLDFSRSDYFDFVHADEPHMTFSKDMSAEDFHLFLLGQPKEERWVYEMYRTVYQLMKYTSGAGAEVITEKYGLIDGKQRSNAAIAEKFRRQYYSEYGYTWNTARVSSELHEGLEWLRGESTLRRFSEEIKKLFLG